MLNHDMSDEYKSRDYVLAISLQDGYYKGNIFIEYGYNWHGMNSHIVEDAVAYLKSLNCKVITDYNDGEILLNDCNLKADVKNSKISFDLKKSDGVILSKVIKEGDLEKYVVGYNLIKCSGHGKKRERRKCESCKQFCIYQGVRKGYCKIKKMDVPASRIICAFDYTTVDND